MKNHSKELGAFLERYVSAHSISFLREDPRDFAHRVLKILSTLYMECRESTLFDVLKVKLLNGLWNNVMDDIIEYTDKGKHNIIESLEALIKSRKGENFNGETETGQIMYNFIKGFYNLPLGPNKEISEELIFLDIVRVLNGFDYERIVHENDTIGTFSEYMEFAAATADLRIFLDIDIAVYPDSLSLSTIGDLREAYRWFDHSLRLISDIASFEREYFVEKSQNSVILLGQKKKVLPRDILNADHTYKEQLFKDAIPSVTKEIEGMAKEYFSTSLKYLHKVSEVDVTPISEGFRLLFEEYPWHIDFSPPSHREKE